VAELLWCVHKEWDRFEVMRLARRAAWKSSIGCAEACAARFWRQAQNVLIDGDASRIV
jgi:hypothetical protein